MWKNKNLQTKLAQRDKFHVLRWCFGINFAFSPKFAPLFSKDISWLITDMKQPPPDRFEKHCTQKSRFFVDIGR